MLPRRSVPAPALILSAGFLLALCTGCPGSRPPASHLNVQSQAPETASQHPNPNAPYVVPAAQKPPAQQAAVPPENVPPCDPNVLAVEQISGNSNANLRTMKLAFVNRGPAPCRLGGYPIVSLLQARGEAAGSLAAQRVSWSEVQAEIQAVQSAPPSSGPATPAAPADRTQPQVTLMPRAVAAFQLAWTTGATCTAVTHILVTPPATSRAFSINQPTRICRGSIQVTDLRSDPGND